MIGFIIGFIALLVIIPLGRYFFNQTSSDDFKWSIGYWTGFIGAVVSIIINVIL